MKRLMRSQKDQKIAGVIGGLGEYLEIDPNLLRIGVVLLFFISAGIPVLLTYLVAWFVLPEAPDDTATQQTASPPQTTSTESS
jgi:phage shock protein PspC (stress-responsive transcriptional regulator)